MSDKPETNGVVQEIENVMLHNASMNVAFHLVIVVNSRHEFVDGTVDGDLVTGALDSLLMTVLSSLRSLIV